MDNDIPSISTKFFVPHERDLGAKVNLILAAEYYKKSAHADHADESTNFGFCLEHGRRFKQTTELAFESCKQAANCGHPEAEQHSQRCLRLLDRWLVRDRSGTARH
jgi:TPR repeat protein